MVVSFDPFLAVKLRQTSAQPLYTTLKINFLVTYPLLRNFQTETEGQPTAYKVIRSQLSDH